MTSDLGNACGGCKGVGVYSDFFVVMKLGELFWGSEEGRRDVQSPQGARSPPKGHAVPGDCRRGWRCSRDGFCGCCPPLTSLVPGFCTGWASRSSPERCSEGARSHPPPPGPKTQRLGWRSAPRGTTGHFCVCPPALGTFAVLSLMTGSAVERLVPEPLGGNLSAIEREQLDAQRVGAAAALAFGSGALMVREDPGGPGGGAHAGGLGKPSQGKGWGRCARKRARCAPAVTGHLPPAAGDVRAAARRPVHLPVRARG